MKLGSWLGIVVSLVLLALALRNVEFGAMGAALQRVDYLYVLLGTLLVIATFWLKAVRWQVLLGPVGEVSVGALFSAVSIGMMANNLLPARVGEIVRAVIVGRRPQIGFGAAFATVVVERVFDGLMVLLLLLGILLTFPLPDWVHAAGWLSAALYGGVLFGLITYSVGRRRLDPWVARLLRPFPQSFRETVSSQLERFASGLLILQAPRRIVASLLLSALLWAVFAAIVEVMLRSFALDLPPMATLVLLLFTALGVTLPSAPAYVGAIQIAFVLALGLFGISESVALGISLIFHAANFMPNTLLGLFFLWRESLELGQLAKMAQTAAHAPPLSAENARAESPQETDKADLARRSLVD